MTGCHLGNWNRDFPKWKPLCEAIDSVRSCFDLTENNVVLAYLRVNRHAFHRLSVHLKRICNSFPKFWNFPFVFIKSVSLSNCNSAMKNLSGRFWGYFENLSTKVMYYLRLKTNSRNGVLANLCLSVCPSVLYFVRKKQLVCQREFSW
jgi:hypothetical protein